MVGLSEPGFSTLRVGLVGPVPPPNGGMAMQTAQLKVLLEGEGLTVELLPTNPPYRPRWLGRVPVLRALGRLLGYARGCWRIAGRCDVIHLMANSGWSWHLFAAPVLLLAPVRGAPVIVNYRGGEARDFFRRSIRWVRPMLRRAAAVVVPSAYLQQVFREFDEHADIVPNIIDRTRFFPPGDRADPPGTFVFVITRNLERIYGIDTAIRALALLRDRAPEARLEIAGSGPEEPSLRILMEELGLSNAVRFLGRLDRDGIVDLYHRADAMLNPTTVDNMPNSVLEALACAVPVISSNVGGVPYIVRDGETALLVPVGDSAAMADAMQALMQDRELREQLRRNGGASIAAFEWSAVCPRWLDVYRRAVAA